MSNARRYACLPMGLILFGCSTAMVPTVKMVPSPAPSVNRAVQVNVAEKELPPQSTLATSKPFPNVSTGLLANGMALDVIERRGLPILSLSLVVNAGQVKDGNHAAVARTTAQLLEAGGAGRFTSESLRQSVDALGASLDTVTTRDTSRFSLSVTSDKLPEALEILSALALQPKFERSEFAKLRARELERVRSLAKENGAWLAQFVLHRELYAQPLGVHPYASVDVLPSELLRLTLDECRRFHKEQYVPGNARLVAVGDIDLPSLTSAAERAFGTWKGTQPVDIGIGAPLAPGKLTVTVVDRPLSAQSDILVGFFGPSRGKPEFPTVAALQQIIGGGVASRLFVDVREKRSLAYSTRAISQETATGPSVLSLGAGTQTAKTAETVGALLENLDRMRSDPGDAKELEVAQSYLIRGMPANWETVESLSGQLILLRNLGQSDRHFDELRESISKLTVDSLAKVAEHYYRKDQAIVVVAGDATAIGESLRKFGPVQILDPAREFVIKRKLDAL